MRERANERARARALERERARAKASERASKRQKQRQSGGHQETVVLWHTSSSQTLQAHHRQACCRAIIPQAAPARALPVSVYNATAQIENVVSQTRGHRHRPYIDTQTETLTQTQTDTTSQPVSQTHPHTHRWKGASWYAACTQKTCIAKTSTRVLCFPSAAHVSMLMSICDKNGAVVS